MLYEAIFDEASIEPRSYERGNVTTKLKAAIADRLQLSHVHTNVETPTQTVQFEIAFRLQLSHVHTNVETTKNAAQIARQLYPASIEPRSYERGNRHAEGGAGRQDGSFN